MVGGVWVGGVAGGVSLKSRKRCPMGVGVKRTERNRPFLCVYALLFWKCWHPSYLFWGMGLTEGEWPLGAA